MEGFVVADDWIGNLSPPIREAIAAQMVLRTGPAGMELLRAGDPLLAIYRVSAGFLKQTGLQEDGERTLLTIYGPGACFAETALIVGAPLNHTTVALTAAAVECLPAPAFWNLYRAHSEIPDALCRKFAHALRRAVSVRESSASARLNARIELLFTTLARKAGTAQADGRLRVDIPFTQYDVAAHLGVTRQSVQRELTTFKLDGSVLKQSHGWLIDLSKMPHPTLCERLDEA